MPTVIALAVYFCFADLVLISQCLYYNIVNARKARQASAQSAQTDGSEEQPLLSRQDSRSNIGLPGSHRRRSSAASQPRSMSGDDHMPAILEEERTTGREALKNTISVLAVCGVGAAGWAIAWKAGIWTPTPLDEDDAASQHMAVDAQVLGYISAVCYLGARLPQIYKNWREKSCEGLSLLFFMLSLLGNATYGAGVSLTIPRPNLPY